MDGSARPSYRIGMTRGTLRIRLIALAAAYALALQGLFAAWAPMALAVSGFPLCSGEMADAPQGSDRPGGHDRACVSACVSIGVTAIPAPPGVAAERHAVAMARTPAPVAQASPGAPSGPLTARAPPAA
jgi:hypothetical protein